MRCCAIRLVPKVREARITDRRWTVDLEKRIQEEHYEDAEYEERY